MASNSFDIADWFWEPDRSIDPLKLVTTANSPFSPHLLDFDVVPISNTITNSYANPNLNNLTLTSKQLPVKQPLNLTVYPVPSPALQLSSTPDLTQISSPPSNSASPVPQPLISSVTETVLKPNPHSNPYPLSPRPTLTKKRRATHALDNRLAVASDSRQRHNEMMRKNRYKFNAKFEQLTNLLRTFEHGSTSYKPMKNKIQTLERAIFQYALMQRNSARFRSAITFCADSFRTCNISNYVDVFSNTPELSLACQQLLQHVCATYDWKYAEVWLRHASDYHLRHVLIPNNNMPDTRERLSAFADHTRRSCIDPLLVSQAAYSFPIWIPDLSAQQPSKSSRANAAHVAGITSTIIIPISLHNHHNLSDGSIPKDATIPESGYSTNAPDAILTLMHVNDELLSYPNMLRPYDATTMCELMHLVSAVAKSRSKSSH